jgi:integrase
MLTDAINEGFHPGPNPFSNLRLDQSRGRKDLTALTESEVVRLADCALDCLGSFGPTFRAMILFAAYVGLRPGELYALERRDVAQDEIVIRQNLDGTEQIKAPKNGQARTVVLPPPAREALIDVPARLDEPWFLSRHAEAVSQRQPSALLASCAHGFRLSRHCSPFAWRAFVGPATVRPAIYASSRRDGAPKQASRQCLKPVGWR